MSGYTPGPWFFGEDGFNLGNAVVYARHSNGNPKDICTASGWGDERKENVRLIAASPDLLEACQDHINTLRSQIRDGKYREEYAERLYQAEKKMMTAIAKATGETV